MSRLRYGIIILALAAPLLAHLYLGQFNRAMADDFCFTSKAQALGVGGALDWWYHNWSSYYSAGVGQSVIGLARVWSLVPSTLIIIWVGVAIWSTYQFALAMQLSNPRPPALIAGLLIVFAANGGTANVYQSLYWTSGAVTYTVPVIVLMLNLGVMLRAIGGLYRENLRLPWLVLSTGLCMLTGGFSPMIAIFQLALFGILLGVVWWFAPVDWKKQALIVLGINAIFGLIALCILYFAPGNAIRRDEFQLELSFLQIVLKTIEGSLAYIVLAFTRLSPLIFLATGFTAYLLGLNFRPTWINQLPRRILRIRARTWFLLILSGGLILIAAAVFTSVASINLFPPPRAYIIPHTVLVLLVLAGGYLIGMTRLYNPNSVRLPVWSALAVSALVVSSIVATSQTLVFTPEFAVFAQEWDERDTYIRAIASENSQAEVVVQDFTVDFADYAGVLKLEDDPDRNICVADYYGIKSIRVSH